MNFRPIHLVLLLAACFASVSCQQPRLTTITGNTMGTTYSVKVVDRVDKQLLEKQIETRLIEVNQLMSTYIPDSELSRINQLAIGESMSLSDENLAMLALARKLHQLSGGKFDVTIGPLVNLWHFGPDPRTATVPPADEIANALAQVGTDQLKLDGSRFVKTSASYVDLSAIAKGYGVDELARIVEAAGAKNYLVEIGGELRAAGRNIQDQIWRVGIEKPDVTQRIPFTVVPLDNKAMATSGDYRNYFEVDGKRYSHSIDPTTGYPITHNVASVTVIADTTAYADGIATAINVMGAEAGMKMANEQDIAALVILKTSDGFAEQYSHAFANYLNKHAGRLK